MKKVNRFYEKSIKFILFVVFLTISANPIFAASDYDAGLKAYNQGHYSIAKALFQKAIQKNSKDVNARYMLSQIYVKEKNYLAAKNQYQYIIKAAPDSQAAEYSKQGLNLLTSKTAQSSSQSSSKSSSTTAKPSGDFGVLKADTIKTPNPTNQYLKFYYYIPENLQNKSGYPIVFFIPGLYGDGKPLLYEGAQEYAKKYGYAIGSITFKFNDKDFNNQASYQYPQAWAGQAFKDILAKLKSKNIQFKDVYLVGFSAGAQFSSRFAMQNPNFLKGCAILGNGAKIVPDKKQNTRFYVAIGEKETDFRKESYKRFLEGAQSAGLDVTSKIYPKLGHETNEQTDQDVVNFIVETMNMK